MLKSGKFLAKSGEWEKCVNCGNLPPKLGDWKPMLSKQFEQTLENCQEGSACEFSATRFLTKQKFYLMRVGGDATTKFQRIFQVMKFLVLLNLTHPDVISLKSLTFSLKACKVITMQQTLI